MRPKVQKRRESSKLKIMNESNPKRIKIDHVRRMYAVSGLSLISLDEVDSLILHKRNCNENGVYKPEVTVVIYNTESLYIGIYVALGEDGKYYTDYNVEFPTGGSDGWPSRSGRGSKALIQALCIEIGRLKEYRHCQGDLPDKRIVRIAEEALRKVKSKRLRQLSIFDILSDETIKGQAQERAVLRQESRLKQVKKIPTKNSCRQAP